MKTEEPGKTNPDSKNKEASEIEKAGAIVLNSLVHSDIYFLSKLKCLHSIIL